MSGGDITPSRAGSSFIERRARKIADARWVTVGLAVTFVALAFVGGILMWIADQHNFPSLGLAFWWALQTITTVGYGDVVPTTVVGRVIGSIEMVLGISFFAFLTAAVTSTAIHRAEARAQEDDRRDRERTTRTILDALSETRQAIDVLDERLARIESETTN